MGKKLKILAIIIVFVLLVALASEMVKRGQIGLSIVIALPTIPLSILLARLSGRMYKGASTVLAWIASLCFFCGLIWLWPSGIITDFHLWLLMALNVVLHLWDYISVG